jgi:hypothetical protein
MLKPLADRGLRVRKLSRQGRLGKPTRNIAHRWTFHCSWGAGSDREPFHPHEHGSMHLHDASAS